jgi:hypothetical protein
VLQTGRNEVIHVLRTRSENEKQISVIPAWSAGIQVRKDASGDIHVGLDSSTQGCNDPIAISA